MSPTIMVMKYNLLFSNNNAYAARRVTPQCCAFPGFVFLRMTQIGGHSMKGMVYIHRATRKVDEARRSALNAAFGGVWHEARLRWNKKWKILRASCFENTLWTDGSGRHNV
eukprot:2735970-Amphidinium_carterae.1